MSVFLGWIYYAWRMYIHISFDLDIMHIEWYYNRRPLLVSSDILACDSLIAVGQPGG